MPCRIIIPLVCSSWFPNHGRLEWCAALIPFTATCKAGKQYGRERIVHDLKGLIGKLSSITGSHAVLWIAQYLSAVVAIRNTPSVSDF